MSYEIIWITFPDKVYIQRTPTLWTKLGIVNVCTYQLLCRIKYILVYPVFLCVFLIKKWVFGAAKKCYKVVIQDSILEDQDLHLMLFDFCQQNNNKSNCWDVLFLDSARNWVPQSISVKKQIEGPKHI